KLRKLAAKSVLPFLDPARAAAKERELASTPLDVARAVVGDARLASVRLSLFAHSRERYPNGGSPRAQFHIELNSAKARAFEVSVADGNTWSQFGEKGIVIDDLELGSAPLAELPAWVERVAKKLDVHWGWENADVRTTLRGAKRDKFLAWLRGEA